jgi:hypothetical protein
MQVTDRSFSGSRYQGFGLYNSREIILPAEREEVYPDSTRNEHSVFETGRYSKS